MDKRRHGLLHGMANAHQANRRVMLRDLDQMTRRDLMRRSGQLAAGAGLAGGLFAGGFRPGQAQEAAELPEVTEIPEELKGSGEVVVVSWGGAMQDSQRTAYFEPFQRLSGITVLEGQDPGSSQIKAMVDTGNVEWDVVQVDRSTVLLLEEEGDYWEEIDYSLFDTANIDEHRRYRYSIDMLPYATVIAYRTDVFDDGPQSQADFYDVEAFPGARTTEGGSGSLVPFLESAMIADGVEMTDVYPIDIERAFTVLSRIRDSVPTFWDAGAQPAQMLTDGEVAMAHAWNGRIAAIQAEGAPVAITWNEGMLATDVFAIPKGAPNAENAQKFCAFATMAAPQARLSMLIPYGFVNNLAVDLIPEDVLAQLPTAPEYSEQMFVRSIEWWHENREAVLNRWNEWILE